jgi:hypothetical protein
MVLTPADVDTGEHRIVLLDESDLSEADVLAFWAREGTVPPDRALRRVHDVLFVATDGDGRLSAVSTAAIGRNEQLRMDLWYCRVSVAATERFNNLALALVVAARDHLERRYVDGLDTRAAGFAFEVEHEQLQHHRPWGVWRRPGLTFIGENDLGAWVRVRYFPGALVPDPPP